MKSKNVVIYYIFTVSDSLLQLKIFNMIKSYF